MRNPLADDLPDTPGAYVLVIEVAAELRLRLGKGRHWRLPPGRYAYCGSAYGPGGIGARVRRHLRRRKPRRWHVDRLTAAGRIVDLHLSPGGSECALLAGLLTQAGVSVPIPGFGSSDCRHCPAHLVALPDGAELGSVADAT
jgi:Uri superfamily endonuclease